MSLSRRIVVKTISALPLLCLTLLNGEFLVAQPPATPAPGGAKPGVATLDLKLDPELDLILTNWEKAGDFTEKLEGKHFRLVYDKVFMVVKKCEGEFYYEAPDKGRIDLYTPKDFKPGETISVDGKPYAVHRDKLERWVCDGTQVLAIDEERKEFTKVMIPVESRGKNIVDGPMPFLFGISKEKAVVRYDIRLHNDRAKGGQHDLKNGRIHLIVRPLWKVDAANWEMAEVLLDGKTYLPVAIKLFHPGGNNQTVYMFHDIKRNSRRGVFAYWSGSPFEPKLNGYHELTATAMEPTERR